MIQLRAYQERSVAAVLEAFARGARRVLLASPCGSGKTEMGVAVLLRGRGIQRQRAGSTSATDLWVVPLGILAEQARARLESYGVRAVTYVGGRFDRSASVVVATVQALLLHDAVRAVQPDRIVLDEAHHYEAQEWSVVRDRYPEALILGMTATPERDKGERLGPSYDAVVYGARHPELLADGHIVKARLYAPDGVPEGLARHPVESYLHLGDGRKAIAAFGSVEEAERWAFEFRRAGMAAECVHGASPDSWRADKIVAFRSGAVQVLTSVYVLAEGFDVADVGCVILGRRFRFLGTYMQFTGRGLRAAPGKPDAIFIDLTGSSWRHGPPNEDKLWNLDSLPADNSAEREASGGEVADGGRKHRSLPVTDEGLVRVLHGALAPTDPDPDPPPSFERRVVVADLSTLRAISKGEKRKAARKGADVARRWAERKRRRSVPFDVEAGA